MKAVITNINDLTDSRELMEARPNKFTIIFIYLVMTILVGAITWSYFGQIDIVVKANGIVRPENKIGIIKNMISGNVKNIFYQDGQRVKKGQVLYEIDNSNYVLQNNSLNNELHKTIIETNNLEKFKNSVDNKRNGFNEKVQSDQEFYYKIKQYLADYQALEIDKQKSDLTSLKDKNDNVYNLKDIKAQVEQTEKINSNLMALQTSIENNRVAFTNNDLFSSKYKEYNNAIEKIKNSIEQNKIALQDIKNKENQTIIEIQKQIDDGTTTLSNAKLDLDSYKNQFLVDIRSNIKSYTDIINDLNYGAPGVNQKISTLNGQIDNGNKLLQSIKAGSNLFGNDDNLYKDKYIDYTNNINKVQKIYEEASLNFTNSKASANTNTKQAQILIQKAQQDITIYKGQSLINDQSELKDINTIKDDLVNSLQETNSNISVYDIQISNLNTLIQSIKTNTNLFVSSNVYADRYNNYKSNMIALETASQDTTAYKGQTLDTAGAELNNCTTLRSNLLNVIPGIQSKMNITDLQISNINTLIQSIKSGNNLFGNNDNIYRDRFNNYQDNISKLQKISDEAALSNENINSSSNIYQLQVEKAKQDIDIYKTQIVLSIQMDISDYTKQRDELQNNSIASSTKTNDINLQIKNLQILEQSVQENINLSEKNDIDYYNRYENYKLSQQKMENLIKQQENTLVNLKQKQGDSITNIENEIKNTEITLSGSELDLNKYKNQETLDILQKLDDNSNALKRLNLSWEKIKNQPDLGKISQMASENAIDKYKWDTFVQVQDVITSDSLKIAQLTDQIKQLNLNIQNCVIKSPMEGNINIMKDIGQQELIAGGEEIATIIPPKGGFYKIQIYLANKDVASVHIGDRVKYRFTALDSKEYGQAIGKIINISVDTKVDSKSGSNYYLVESEIQNKPLLSYKGTKADIKLGMTCEAQIISSRKQILHYLLEKINLLD